jgi:hydroxymethylpyrimidine pyrophosphatase-like HAD family hydrolase
MVVSSFDDKLHCVEKIVAVTDDFPVIVKCEEAIHAQLGEAVAASRSQKYYLDVTHPDANKGNGIAQLSRLLKIPAERIATIGDGANDVLMFKVTGFSIAMGNGAPEVQAAASVVTGKNTEDGFAAAMQKFILGPRGIQL